MKPWLKDAWNAIRHGWATGWNTYRHSRATRRAERWQEFWTRCSPDELAWLVVDTEDRAAARVDATFRLAAKVCDDFARRSDADRKAAINREEAAASGVPRNQIRRVPLLGGEKRSRK